MQFCICTFSACLSNNKCNLRIDYIDSTYFAKTTSTTLLLEGTKHKVIKVLVHVQKYRKIKVFVTVLFNIST